MTPDPIRPGEQLRFPAPDERTMSDELRELAELARGLKESVDRLKEEPKPKENGNSKATDAFWRVVIGLALAGTIAAHAFLWRMNSTIAVQTEQIQRLREDVANTRAEMRQEIRENRDEFIKANTDKIDRLDARMRRLENGRNP